MVPALRASEFKNQMQAPGMVMLQGSFHPSVLFQSITEGEYEQLYNSCDPTAHYNGSFGKDIS